jgi:ribonuclease D
MIDTEEKLKEMTESLLNSLSEEAHGSERLLGVDLENHHQTSYNGYLCLI